MYSSIDDTLFENEWAHIAATYDGSHMSLYINGELIKSKPQTGLLESSNKDLTVGSIWGGWFLKADLDNVSVYAEALSQERVQALFRGFNESALIHLAFDEGSGVITHDSGSNLQGIIENASFIDASAATNSFISMNGSGAVTVPYNNIMDINSITISAWINPSRLYRNQSIVSKNGSFYLNLRSSQQLEFGLRINNLVETVQASISQLITTDKWSHLVATYDGTEMVLYINGERLNSKQQAGQIDAMASDLTLGTDSNSYRFNGSLDNVDIFDSALSEAAVQNLMRGEKDMPLISFGFQEGHGSKVVDSYANLQGTLSNVEFYSEPPQGNRSVHFDRNGSITVPHDSALNVQNALTISAWVNPKSSTLNQSIIEKNNAYYLRMLDDQSLHFGVRINGTWQIAQIPTMSHIRPNQWSHLVATYDGSAISMYLDGKLAVSRPQTGLVDTSTAELLIGTNALGWNFDGGLDGVNLYSHGFVEDDVTQVITNDRLTPNLAFTFEEGQGSNIYDSSTLISGVLNNAQFQADAAQGNYSVFFDGNASISVPYHSVMAVDTELTLSAWINPTVLHTNQNILNRNNTYYLNLTSNQTLMLGLRINGSWRTASVQIDHDIFENQWSHIAATYDGSSMHIYIDGELVESHQQTGAIDSSNKELRLGSIWGGRHFNGALDHVQIYNTALNAQAIRGAMRDRSVSADILNSIDIRLSEAAGNEEATPETSSAEYLETELRPSELDLSKYTLFIGDQNNDGLQDLYFRFDEYSVPVNNNATTEYIIIDNSDFVLINNNNQSYIVHTLTVANEPAPGEWNLAVDQFYTITSSDFNGDLLVDYFIGSRAPGGLSFFVLGNQAGEFTITQYIGRVRQAVDGQTMHYGASDINNDGIDDLIIRQSVEGQHNSALLSIVYGETDGTFIVDDIQDIQSGETPNDIATATANNNVENAALEEEIISGDEVGFVAGQHQVSPTGAFEYTVPISLPDGINGIQPNLSVNYSSQGGNGLLGVGMNLAGAGSSITRCPTNRVDDSDIDPVDYDDNDQYCLDGARLVHYGNNEYGLKEGSGPLKIVYENINKQWKVYSRDANLSIYGADVNSRIYKKSGLSDNYASTDIFSWAISSTEDQFNARMDYSYYTDHVEGSQNIKSIQYNGYEIEFEYQDRPDQRAGVAAVGGPYLRTTSRLKKVKIKNSNNIISEYVMSYGADHAKRSLLKGVTQCNGTGDCLPATLLHWDTSQVSYTPTTVNFNVGINGDEGNQGDDIARLKWGDFNGDGRTDLYYVHGQKSVATQTIHYATDVEGQFINSNATQVYAGQGDMRQSIDRIIPGDFDGDSIGDIYFAGGNGAHDLHGFSGQVHQFVGSNNWQGPRLSWGSSRDTARLKFGDFDGNGALDFYWVNGFGHNNHLDEVFLFGENQQEPLVQSVSTDQNFHIDNNLDWFGNNLFRIRTGDFNGDGKTDLYVQALEPRESYQSNTGNTSVASHYPYYPATQDQIYFATQNGEFSAPVNVAGVQYPFRIHELQKNTHETRHSTFNGYHYAYEVEVQAATTDAEKAAFDLARFQFIDINGDGKTDIYYQAGFDTNNNARDIIYLGLGDGSFKQMEGIQTRVAAHYNMGMLDLNRINWVDYNADGLLDLYFRTGDGPGNLQDLVFIQNPSGNRLFEENPISVAIASRMYRYDPESTGTQDYQRIQFHDFNADGIADILQLSQNLGNNPPEIHYSSGGKTLLNKITNGLGAWVKPTYQQLNETGYTQAFTNCASPIVCPVTSSMLVVTQLEVDNGIGGINSIEYSYDGLRSHKDYGLLGFENVYETSHTMSSSLPDSNVNSNPQHTTQNHTTVTRTTYSQDAEQRFVGMPLYTSTSIDSQLINETFNVLVREPGDPANNENPLSKIQRSITKAYDIDGHFLGLNIKSTQVEAGKPRLPVAQIECTMANDVALSFQDILNDNLPSCPEAISENNTVKLVKNYTDTKASHLITFADNASIATDSLVQSSRTVVEIPASATAPHARTKLTTENGFEYASGKVQVVSETSNTYESVNDPQYAITQTNTYDHNGLPRSTTVSGAGGTDVDGMQTYTASTYYDSRGRLISSTNGLGHTTMQTYSTKYPWVEISSTNAIGLRSAMEYDHMGRLQRAIDPLGITSTSTQGWCQREQACAYWKRTASTAGTASITFYDSLNRPLKSAAQQAGNNDAVRYVQSQTTYDAYGHKLSQHGPVETAGLNFNDALNGAGVRTYAGFDAIGRPIHVINGDMSHGRTAYQGNTTYYFDHNNWSASNDDATTTTYKDFLGQTIRVKDRAGNNIYYSYDVQGNLVQTTDHAGNTIKTHFNVLGQKVSMEDPDQGHWTYRYDLNGRLTAQTDAKGQITMMEYDILGRMIQRTDLAGTSQADTTEWRYGTHSLNRIALHQIIGQGVTRTLDYDVLGRVTSTTTEMDGETFVNRSTYDELGRVDTTHAPGGHLNLKHHYHPIIGHLTAVEDLNTNIIYWQLNETDVRGNITKATLGNGVVTTKGYDSETGRLINVRDINAISAISHFSYDFDEVGNLRSRSNNKQDRIETFNYDNIYRLTTSALYNGLGNAHNASELVNEINLTYDALGNITTKSDIGAYEYGVLSGRNCVTNHAGPHAVTRISGQKNTNYCYDANGNMVTGDGRSILYTSFNKPTRIEQIKNGQANQVDINYGPERSRIKRTDSHNGQFTTTQYLGNLEIVTANGFREWKYSIGDYAQKIYKAQDQSTRVNYFHRDHLGSLIAITDEVGILLEEFSFDAWGKRRYLDWQGEIDLYSFSPSIGWETHRGFTNHEHLDSVGLIHMNGRVYDPAIGRFLSADPNIQAPHNLQNFNRYSYVNNNPLSYTDPSGYFFKKLKKVFKNIGRAIKKNWRAIVAIAIVVVMPYALGVLGANTFWAASLSGGFSSAYASGSGKGFWSGFVTGGLLHGVGSAAGLKNASFAPGASGSAVRSGFKKLLAHGLIGGGMSKYQGGKFSQGFSSMAFTQAVSLSGAFDSGFFASNGNENAAWRAKQAIGSGVVGGLGAIAGGGNSKAFVYGAVQGAMSRFLNDNLHKDNQSSGCKNWGTNSCMSANASNGEIKDLPEWVIEASAGFGDSISFGSTRLIREVLNISSPVANSSVYNGAMAVGGVYIAATGSGLLLRGSSQAIMASTAITAQSTVSTIFNGPGSYSYANGSNIVNIMSGFALGNSPPGRVGQSIINFHSSTSSVMFEQGANINE